MTQATGWALVSEPGFLKFQIFRFPIFVFLFIWNMLLENMLVRYRGINNKGVLESPGTKWKVLRTISSTLKCKFIGNHENKKIRLFGETEHRRPGVYKVAQCVSVHFCRVKTPINCHMGSTSPVFRENLVFSRFTNKCLVIGGA